MPAPAGDRFSSQNMSDCEFCPPDGRRFRTQRQCVRCNRNLCIVCRPCVPGVEFLCPDCGGGPAEDTLHHPDKTIERLTSAGVTVPFWLCLLRDRMTVGNLEADEVIVPE
jgi:hypothetical protein